jgi:hypothetical protein
VFPMHYYFTGEHPAQALVTATLNEQKAQRMNSDNLTVVVILFDRGKIAVNLLKWATFLVFDCSFLQFSLSF